jgi:hypothetical protein
MGSYIYCISNFDNGILDLLDSVGGLDGVDDAVVDNSIDVHDDVVFREDELPLEVDHLGL